jgi:DNA mismatch endonuclease (patch repair protein)
MRRVKGRNTGPERAVRQVLTRLGARYRLHRADLPGRPDIILPGRRLAVLIHGCFWHGHRCARGSRSPKTNAEYWTTKIARNRARDRQNAALLRKKGWKVLTIWECDSAPSRVRKLKRALAVRRPA